MEERRLDPPWHKLEEQCAGSKVDERNGTDTDGGGGEGGTRRTLII